MGNYFCSKSAKVAWTNPAKSSAFSLTDRPTFPDET